MTKRISRAGRKGKRMDIRANRPNWTKKSGKWEKVNR